MYALGRGYDTLYIRQRATVLARWLRDQGRSLIVFNTLRKLDPCFQNFHQIYSQ
jgi:hypothetical protein